MIFLLSGLSANALSSEEKEHAARIKEVRDQIESKSSSGIKAPPYTDQISKMEEFARVHSDIAEVIHYGDSVGARKLMGLLIRKAKPSLTTRLTIVTGATHGNEYLNIADRLAEELINIKDSNLLKYLNNGGSFFIIPVMNPDGYAHWDRENSNGVDLNRDWPSEGNNYKDPTQVESWALLRFVEDYISKGRKLDLVVDYHCCVGRGVLLIPWGWKKSLYMSEEDRDRSKKFEVAMTSNFRSRIKIGTPPDILYSATGATLDYWYEKYNAVSLTYEGSYRREHRKLSSHVSWWNEMFSILAL
jgi:hypothetical protein